MTPEAAAFRAAAIISSGAGSAGAVGSDALQSADCAQKRQFSEHRPVLALMIAQTSAAL